MGLGPGALGFENQSKWIRELYYSRCNCLNSERSFIIMHLHHLRVSNNYAIRNKRFSFSRAWPVFRGQQHF